MKRNRRRNYCKCPSRVTEGKGENEDCDQNEKLNPEVAVTMKIRNENGEGRSIAWQVRDVVSSDIIAATLSTEDT